MLRIREIGEDELEELVAVSAAAMPRDDASVAGFIDWLQQAEAMVWLLAERDEETVGGGYALTGWHTPPHRAMGAALVPPKHRGAGVGIGILDALEGWAGDKGATELEGPVEEDDDKSLAWAAGRGYSEAGRDSRLVLDLTAIDAPDPAPPAGIEIVAWSESARLAAAVRSRRARPCRTFPARRTTTSARWRKSVSRDMQATTTIRARFSSRVDGEVAGFAKLALLPERTDRAYHDLTGVRRDYRGRGSPQRSSEPRSLGRSSRAHALQTSNELETSRIRRLNERHR